VIGRLVASRVAAALVCALFAAAGPAAADLADLLDGDWVEVSSPSFVLLSRDPADETRELASDAPRARADEVRSAPARAPR